MSNEGAAIGADGWPHCGPGLAGSACGRLLAYFRERTGQEISGKTMDDEISDLHGDRNASTRKHGICERIDPRVEWLFCTRRRVAGHLRFFYKHVYTRGRVPFERPLRKGGLTPELRLVEIQVGTRTLPARYYQVARDAGLLPEDFEIPGALRPEQIEPKPAPIETVTALKLSIEAHTTGQGNLWDTHPRPR